MLARAWKDRVTGLARLAAGLGAWFDASLVNRWLCRAGVRLGTAVVTSAPARALWWDRGVGEAAEGGRVGTAAVARRWWGALMSGPGRLLAEALDASGLARAWRGATSWLADEGARHSLTVRLWRWYYRDESGGPGMGTAAAGKASAAPVVPASGIAGGGAVAAAPVRARELLRGWTLLALHLLVWLLPVVSATKLLLLAGVVLALILARLLVGERLRGSTLLVPFAVFLGLNVLATVSSVLPHGSLRDLSIVIASGGVLFAVVNLGDRRDWYGLLASFVAVATLVAALGLYQYAAGRAVTSSHWFDAKTNPDLTARVYSTFGNPNILAEYLVLVIPAVVGLFWSERNGPKQLLFAAMAGITGLCLVLTFSRGAWLGMAVAALVFVAIMEARVLWLVPVGAVGGYFLLPPVIHARLASIVNLSDASNAYRLNIWIATVRMIKDYWVTGVGLGYRSFMWVYQEYKLRGQIAWHSHNQYLEQFSELGIIGLALFVWLMLRVAAAGGSALRRSPHADRRLRSVAAGGVASVAGILFYGFFENIFYLPTVIVTFWVVAGLTTTAGLLAADGRR